MTSIKLQKKALFSAFFLLLSSCSHPCSNWNFEETQTTCPSYQSAKIYTPAQNSFDGLEVELIATLDNAWMFLNIYSTPLSGDAATPGIIAVNIVALEESWQTSGVLFEGGQRIALNDEARDYIIEALLNNQPITITVDRYHAELSPEGFPKAYFKLVDISRERRPFFNFFDYTTIFDSPIRKLKDEG